MIIGGEKRGEGEGGRGGGKGRRTGGRGQPPRERAGTSSRSCGSFQPSEGGGREARGVALISRTLLTHPRAQLSAAHHPRSDRHISDTFPNRHRDRNPSQSITHNNHADTVSHLLLYCTALHCTAIPHLPIRATAPGPRLFSFHPARCLPLSQTRSSSPSQTASPGTSSPYAFPVSASGCTRARARIATTRYSGLWR